MRTKIVTSIALLFMLMLLGQAMTGHLYQYPGVEVDSSLESESIVMASNSTDTDGDGVYDADDACPNGNSNWNSTPNTDYDSDGCRDASEDTDDDNDGVSDSYDDCMVGNVGWTSSISTDYDSDGCQDASTEDVDDDNDGVVDSSDSCPKGNLGWTSTSSTDADGDGCRDSTEDVDGGNGSGNNTSGNQTSPCGYNSSYTSVYAYAPYSVMENQSFSTSMYVSCEIYNANMVLVYWINDADINATSSLANGSMSWTGANSYSNFNWNVSGLSAGNYTFHVELYVNGTSVDSDYDSFMVYADSSGGGGNNGGNNPFDDAHCLILQNASMNQSHHITVELVNTCSIGISYAGIDASTDNSEVFGLYDTWWYVIGGNTSSGLSNTYTMNWQLSFGPNLTTGTVISIYLQATVLNCGSNNSWSHQCPNATDSMLTYQFTFNGNNGNNNSGENNSGNNTASDTDGDGIIDSLDNCLNGSSNWTSTATTDYDSDGCEDASEDTDDDNDGVSDSADAFPTDPSETEDTDGDGVGNNADTDDDNDGVGDNLDTFPLDSSEAFDNDGDGVGDNADMDDDNDGVSDQEDAFPFDGGASNDTDVDGVADAYDNCIAFFNPSQADADMDGIGTECDDDESSGNSGNSTGNNTDQENNTGNNTENNSQNTGDLLVIGDCTFSEMNFDNAAHVIFYLSWTDTSDVDHCGTIQFELYSNEAPIHVQNFQDHVGAGNYDGVIFHRIINDFMTQSGDIQYGNGMGGYAYSWQGYCNGQQIEQANCQLNDYSIPDEFDTSLVHNKGALSMAHAGANTGGSQFFIMDRDDATWLDGVHSVFGQAIAGTIDGVEVTGIEVVDAISQVGVEGPSGSTPIHDVTILSAENIGTPQTIENPSLPDDESDDESIPSIGMIGTAVAISAGFFVAIRREDEE